MKKYRSKVFIVFLVLTMLTSIFPSMLGINDQKVSANSAFGGGTGTKSDPYLISTYTHLSNISNINTPEVYYKLVKDIDLLEYPYIEWTPITIRSTEFHFDGNGMEIQNLLINRSDLENVGLFATIPGSNSTVGNLTIAVFNIIGQKNVGALAGSNEGTINNVVIKQATDTPSIKATDGTVGGLVGINHYGATIDGSSNSVNVAVEGKAPTDVYFGQPTYIYNIGGLVGENYGLINHSWTSGLLNAIIAKKIGGLAGYNEGHIFASYSSSGIDLVDQVSGLTLEHVGGLVGYQGEVNSTASISNSYATGSFEIDKRYNKGVTRNVGGIVGTLRGGSVSNSYATGTINVGTYDNSGQDSSHNLGGIVGSVAIHNNNKVKVTNNYATSLVKARGIYTGTRPQLNIGGIVGHDGGSEENTHYENNYYLGYPISSTIYDTFVGTNLTDNQMKTSASYTGWDFVNIWQIDSTKNGGYPYYRSSNDVGAIVINPMIVNTIRNTEHTFSARLLTIDNQLNSDEDIAWTISDSTGVTIDGDGNLSVSNSAEYKTYIVRASLASNPAISGEAQLSVLAPIVERINVTLATRDLAIGAPVPVTVNVTGLYGVRNEYTTVVTTEYGSTPMDHITVENNQITVNSNALLDQRYRVEFISIDDPTKKTPVTITVVSPYLTFDSITNEAGNSALNIAQGTSKKYKVTSQAYGNISTEISWGIYRDYSLYVPVPNLTFDEDVLTATWDASPGSYYIGVKSIENPKSLHSQRITVEGVSTVSFASLTETLLPGESKILQPKVTKTGAAISGELNWTTTDTEGNITVDPTGKVEVSEDAIPGEYEVIATSQFNHTKSATVTIIIPEPITAVHVIPLTLTLRQGGTAALEAEVISDSPDVNKDVTWSSDSNKVLVDESGNVTVLDDAPAGTYTVTATSDVNTSITGTATITVTSVDGVSLNQSDVSLLAGESVQLEANVSVSGEEDLSLTWSSSHLEILSVDTNGLVSVEDDAPVGNYTITATSNADSNKKASATISVMKVKEVNITPNEVNIHQGYSKPLSAAVVVENGEAPEVTWSSVDSAIVVDEDGEVTVSTDADPTKTYTITATSKRDPSIKGTAIITVTAVTGVTVTPETKVLLPGQTVELIAEVGVVGNGDRTVRWTSSDSDEVSVSTSGVVTVATDAAPGEYTITATSTVDGNKRGSAIIEVARVNGVTVDVTEASLLAGEILQLNAAATVEGNIATTVVWSSADDQAVIVDSVGLVTVTADAAPRDVKLTATSTIDSSKKAEVTISVMKVKEVNITPNEVNIHQGYSKPLSATVVVENGEAPEVTWSSVDSAIVVDEDGEVTVSADADPMKTYTITATSKRDPSVTGTALITVTAVTGVTVTPETKVLLPGQTVELTAEVGVVGNVDRTVTWTSSNSAEVSVSTSGVVTVATDATPGEYTITATSTVDGTRSGTAIIEVAGVNDVTIEAVADTSLIAGESLQLNGYANVQGNIETTVTWSSNHAAALAVDSDGLVTVASDAELGEYTITAASTADPSKTAKIAISVIVVNSINVTPNQQAIHQGESASFVASVEISDGSPDVITLESSNHDIVTWSSSDHSAVTVSEEGEVTVAIDADPTKTYTITATSKKDPSISGTTTISVTAVTGVTVSPDTITLWNGIEQKLEAHVTVVGEVDTEVIWSSSDENAILVSQEGVVSVVEDAAPGQYFVTVTSVVDERQEATAIVNIAKINGVTLNLDQVMLQASETVQLQAIAAIEGEISDLIQWSSDSEYVKVDSEGNVTVLADASPGDYVITASSVIDESKYAQSTIQVYKVNKVTITPTEAIVHQGNTYELIASVEVENGEANEVVWSSNNPDAVSVSNGIVSISPNADPITYTITAASVKNLAVSTQATITVTAVVDVAITPIAATVRKGKTEQLSVTVNVVGEVDQSVDWSSSNINFVTVNEEGLVTVLQNARSGKYTITATSTVDHTKVAKATITVPSDVVSLPDPAPTPGIDPNEGTESNTGTEPGEGTEPDEKTEQDPGKDKDAEQDPGEDTTLMNSVFASDKVNREQLFESFTARAQQSAQAAEKKVFNDVEQHWANSAIQLAVALNVVNGYADGSFKPNTEITRAEFAVIIVNVFGIQALDSEVSLQDVEGHWAKPEIAALAQAGVVGGYRDGTFRPNQTITREEIVIILSRIVNLNNVEKDATKGSFTDLDLASSYAVNTIQLAAQAGIINGKGESKFDPQGQATRAEALTIIINALKLDKDIATILEQILN